MYIYSDAWFLTSLILNKDWSSLQQVIVTGDAINHAIFTRDEINVALSKFIALNYVEMDTRKNMRATSKAFELCNKSFLTAGLFSKVEKILNKLNRADDCGQKEIIEYFSEMEINQAYKKYCRMFYKG